MFRYFLGRWNYLFEVFLLFYSIIEMFEGNFSKKLKKIIYARIVINFKLLVLLTDYERFVEKFRLSIEIARYFQKL